MWDFIIEYWKAFQKQKGQILVLTALLLPLLLAASGLAIDFGNLYVHKARLQNAADAAALVGGHKYSQYSERIDSHPNADSAADASITSNMPIAGLERYNDALGEYKVGQNPSTNAYYYRVRLTEDVPVYFLKYFAGIPDMQPVGAVAYAKVVFSSSTGGGTAVSDSSLFKNLFSFGYVVNIWYLPDSYGLRVVKNQREYLDNENAIGDAEAFNGNIVYIGSTGFLLADMARLEDTQYDNLLITSAGRDGGYATMKDAIKANSKDNVTYQSISLDRGTSLTDGLEDIKEAAKSTSNSVTITQKQSIDYLSQYDTVYVNDQNAADLTIDKDLSGSNNKSPLYFIINESANGAVPKIEIKTKMTSGSRPVVFVYTGTNEVWINAQENSPEFHGIIYAPNAKVGINDKNFNFYGSIIARQLYIGGQESTFNYENVLSSSSGGTTTPGSVGLAAPESGIEWGD